jgi:polysaccharide pyruvyl transferase WcaK-like protein
MDLLVPNRSTPRLAAFGEWDGTNLGDRAILEGVRTFFRAAGWHVDAYGLGTLLHCQEVSRAYTQPLNSPKECLRETAFAKLRDSLPTRLGTSYPDTYRLLKRSLRPLRQRLRIRYLIPLLKNAQAILVGGGALLSDSNLHFPQSLAAVTWAAKRLTVPVFCLGCSAEGDWSTRGQKILAGFLRSCSYLAVRDRQTAIRISGFLNAPVDVFGDFALPIASRSKPCNYRLGKRILSINVMQLPSLWEGYQQQYEDIIVQISNAFMQQHPLSTSSCIRLFTTDYSRDVDAAKRILSRLSKWKTCLYVPNSVNELRVLLRSSTAVLASRLHSAILAISECIPVLGLAVSPKIKAFFESIGMQKYVVSIFDNQVNDIVQILLSNDLGIQPLSIDILEMQKTRTTVLSIFHDLSPRLQE